MFVVQYEHADGRASSFYNSEEDDDLIKILKGSDHFVAKYEEDAVGSDEECYKVRRNGLLE